MSDLGMKHVTFVYSFLAIAVNSPAGGLRKGTGSTILPYV